jgi:hypothetical protein
VVRQKAHDVFHEKAAPCQEFFALCTFFHDPELKRFYRRKLIQKGLGKARVAVARKLGIRLWIMLRDEINYQEFCRRGQKQQSGVACAGVLEVGNGANRHRPID